MGRILQKKKKKVFSERSLNTSWCLNRSMNGHDTEAYQTQSTDQTWQKSDDSKGRAVLTCYIPTTMTRLRLRVKIMSKLWTEVVLEEEHVITTNTICAMLERSCNTVQFPDDIVIQTTTWKTWPVSSTLATRATRLKRNGYTLSATAAKVKQRLFPNQCLQNNHNSEHLANYWWKLLCVNLPMTWKGIAFSHLHLEVKE